MSKNSNIKTLTADSFRSVIDSIEAVRALRPDRELWYRGHSSNSYVLAPGLHRLDAPIADISAKEARLYKDFHFRSPMYDSLVRVDLWDQLFLMQHYRLPTRLLDWTASPLVGLFFALSSFKNGPKAKPPVLWVLDPARWNEGMLHDISGPQLVYPTDDTTVAQYHPLATGSRRSEPLGIEGVINNPRINAQRGKFVIFGPQKKSLEQFCEGHKAWNTDVPLTKIEIKPTAALGVYADLQHYGVTYSSVFPDLDGLATEIRGKYGY
ncbi:MAG: FRG domain-containing protein [Hyphomicrobiales bacterium]|nr:MAG: FRG domain-containing protein [Hyphomicrobiales bacterium]